VGGTDAVATGEFIVGVMSGVSTEVLICTFWFELGVQLTNKTNVSNTK
jgi:hypothetical protein